MTRKLVVLHSGGLDSTACLLAALARGDDVLSLGVDYGQRHRIELEYASQQCQKASIPRKVIRVEWDRPRLTIPVGRTIDEIRSGVSTAFLPGRNAVFLMLGCAEAAGIGAQAVSIGVNALDYSGYPDCRPEFLRSFDAMLAHAMPGGPKIEAPLLSMTKPEIAAYAASYGLGPGDTWSCYQPQFVPSGIHACGQCDACVLHDHAWRAVSQSSRGP